MSSFAVASFAPEESRAVERGRLALVGLGTVAAAVAANVLVYAAGGAIIVTLVSAVVAVLLYAALLRYARHPARVFKAVAAVVFVVTLVPDFTYIPTVPGATNGQTAVLVLMHAVAAGVIVGLLTTLARPRSR